MIKRVEKVLFNLVLKVRPAPLAQFIKSVAGIERRVMESDIGLFYADPASHFENTILNNGRYEPDITRTIKQYLSEGDTFVDLGTNEGFFSVLAAQVVGPTGSVVSIEPQSRLAPIIKKNLQLNNVFDRARILHTAVSDHDGEASFHISPDTNTGSSGLAPATRYRVGTEVVPTARLCTLLDPMDIFPIDLIKIDIEGFEYEAIIGSSSLFHPSKIKNVALELHPGLIRSRHLRPQNVTQQLVDNGYVLDPGAPTMLFTSPDSKERDS